MTGSRLSWKDLTDINELLEDKESNIDNEDVAFINEFDKV